MIEEASLDRLIAADVLAGDPDGDLGLADELVEAIDRWRDRVTDADDEARREAVRAVCDGADAGRVLTALDDRPGRVARFLALRSTTDFPVPECLRLAFLTEQFDRERPPDVGVPRGFLAVHGDQLPLVLSLTPRAIVYVWQEECDPCDTMFEEFEDIFGEAGDEELGLYAVYGPGAAEFLCERYDVVGAPTTLFVVEAEVDCRLQGAHYRSVIDSEIATLREVAP